MQSLGRAETNQAHASANRWIPKRISTLNVHELNAKPRSFTPAPVRTIDQPLRIPANPTCLTATRSCCPDTRRSGPPWQ